MTPTADGAALSRHRVIALVACLTLHSGAFVWLTLPARPLLIVQPPRTSVLRIDLGEHASPRVAAITATAKALPPAPQRTPPPPRKAVAPERLKAAPAAAVSALDPLAPSAAEIPRDALQDALQPPPPTPASSHSQEPTPAAAASAELPAIAAAPAAGSAEEIQWQARLLAHLERFRRYPFAARRQQQEGVAWLRFSVDRSGRVLRAQLDRGTAYEALDAEALAVVHRAQPLPPPPAVVAGDAVEVLLPVQFRVHRR